MNGFNLTEDQAITAITAAMDFGVTQVVDGNWCAHHCVASTTMGAALHVQEWQHPAVRNPFSLKGLLCVRGEAGVSGLWGASCRGVHCIVPKWMFNMSDTSPYAPLTMAGTSKPANVTLLTSL